MSDALPPSTCPDSVEEIVHLMQFIECRENDAERAISNAKLAYQTFKRMLASDRWQEMAARGARMQRMLWASTSAKNAAYQT